MAKPWFAAYYTRDVEVHLQAATWEEALLMALERQTSDRGSLECLEITEPTGLQRSHPT